MSVKATKQMSVRRGLGSVKNTKKRTQTQIQTQDAIHQDILPPQTKACERGRRQPSSCAGDIGL